MKVTNGLVTYTDLTTMGLTPKGSPTTGNHIATKQFVINNYYVDESASPFSGYTVLRCPRYQDIIGTTGVPALSIWGARDSFAARSNNAGVNFTNFSGLTDDDFYRYIGASNDGVYVGITVNLGLSDNCKLMVSNNSGATWTSVPHPNVGTSGYNFSFDKIAVSATGQYMVSSFSAQFPSAGRRIVYFVKSINFGVTWQIQSAPLGFYTSNTVSCDISSNGNCYAIANTYENAGNITSGVGFTTDGGVTWHNGVQKSATWFNDIKISTTGQYHIVAASNGGTAEGKIWLSTDFGYTSTKKVDDASYAMDYVTMTDDAVYQIGISRSGKYYISTNSGATFSITGNVSAGSISSISMTAYNYGSTPSIIVYSSNTAFIYFSEYPYSTWTPVAISSILPWKTQRRAIPYPYTAPITPLPYSYLLYYDYNDTLPVVIGFTVAEDACAATNSFVVYSSYSSIGIGTTLYFDLYGTTPIQANPSSSPSQDYYSIGDFIVQFSDSYTVGGTAACPAPPGYDYYYADVYSCAVPCSLNSSSQIVAFPTGSSVLDNYYYSDPVGDYAFSYRIGMPTIDPGYPLPILDSANGPWTSCDLACPVS
jgi:hypothetical protein